MKGFKKVMRGMALSLAVTLGITAVPMNVLADEPEAEETISSAITADDFLVADGKNLVNQKGEVVNLRGTNAGGYLLQEFWMTPTVDSDNVHAESDIYNILTERFGKQAMYEIIDTYQDAYWTEADFDNCAELGMNVIRLPFWWRNLVDANGVFYGTNPFGDVKKSDWFYEYTKFAYEYDLMGGKGTTEDGNLKFDPASTITRAEFIQMLYGKEGKPAVEYQDTFADVSEGKWYTDAIMWAAENEIVGGKKADFFDVSGEITREEIAVVLYKYALKKEYDVSQAEDADLTDFVDGAKVSKWAQESMEWAVAYDVIGGKTAADGMELSPDGCAIRAEAATMLRAFMVAYEGIVVEKEAESSTDDIYAEAFERIDWFIEEAGERGMYVVLDFHGAPGSQNASDHSGVDGRDDKEAASEFFFGDAAEANQELYYDMLEVIAARYAGNPVVAGYDLLNEPFCTWRYNSKLTESTEELLTMLWEVYDKAYDVVRAVDSDHVIIMEATWDPVDLPNPAQYGWENIMYEYHNYLYDDYDNAEGRQITNMQSKLNAIGNADYNVPSYLGEFSYFNSVDTWEEGLELLTNAGINWTTWTYKTTANYGNWGQFHHPAEFNDGINLETATKEEILSWYSRMGETEENTDLTAVTGKWYQAETVENNMSPNYAEIADGEYYLVGNNTMKVLTSDENTNVVAATDSPKNMGDEADQLFTLVNNEDGTVSLKAANGNYLSVSTEDAKLYATAAEAADAEKFYMIEVSATTVAFKSVATDTYVSVVEPKNAAADKDAASYEVLVQAYAISGSETFQLYDTDICLVGAPKLDTYSGWSRYEAEDAAIYNGAAISKDVAEYSGGAAVGSMDNNDVTAAEVAKANWENVKYVEFTVEAPTAGTYLLSLNYNGNDDKTILVKANDEEQQEVSLPSIAGGQWNTLFEKIIEVDLKEGENKIAISGTLNNKGWMNIDCVDIIDAPLGSNDVYTRYEAENYNTNAVVKTGSHFSGGKGIENCNSDVAIEDVAFNWANIKYVDFTIYAEQAGKYTVILGYTGAGTDGMKSLYRVNGGEDQVLTLDNNGGNWNIASTHTFEVELEKGFNTLKISGTVITTDHYANIDYIDVKSSDVKDTPKELEGISGWNHYEVYNATIVGGEEVDDENGSNGNLITGLDNADMTTADVEADWSNINYVEYAVTAPRAGEYRMAVAYAGESDAAGLIKVNDGEAINVVMPATTGTDVKVIVVALAEGENIIRVSGAIGEGTYKLDYVELANAEIMIVDEEKGTERYEAEFFQVKSSNTPAVEQQKGDSLTYSGPNNEGVGGMGTQTDAFTVGDNVLDSVLNYTNFTIYAEEAGEYHIKLTGNGNGADMIGVYQVNDEPSQTYDILNDGASWNILVHPEFTVTLEKGLNQLIITGPYDNWSNWMNFDCIDVTLVEE